jgi:hypothetical protein
MMKKIIIGLLFSLVAFGQQSSITLTAAPPSPISGVNARIVGNQGSGSFYYWVIGNYPIGKSQAVGTFIINTPNVLSVSNYVQVSWNLGAAISADILRTTTPYIPASCTCSLATGSTTSSINDTGGALGAYSYVPVGSATATMRLDNSNFTQPTLFVNAPVNMLTFAKLPTAASSTGLIYLIKDASSTSTCNAGGGVNTPALCWSNGITWIAIGGGGGGGGSSTQFTITNLGNISGAVTLHQAAGNQIFTGTVTGNVVLTSADAGTALFQTVFTSDGTHTVTCDSSFVFCSPMDNTNGVTTVQTFSWSGVSGLATPTLGTNGTGAYLVLPDGTKLTLPSTGPGFGGWNYGLAGAKPASCTVGQMYFATDATAGQNWYYCTTTNVWTQQLNSGGGGGVGTLWVSNIGNIVIGPTTTNYNFPGSVGGQTVVTARQVVIPVACTAKNLYVVTSTAQPADAALTISLWRTADTALQVVVPANGAAATMSDTTHTVALAAGDQVAIEFANASTSNSAAIRGYGLQCQ